MPLGTKSTRTVQDKSEGGRRAKRKTGPLVPGALLVHSDFSLKLRSLALRTSNPPENLLAPDDSHFQCVLRPPAIACHKNFRPLGLCALALKSARTSLVSFLPKKLKWHSHENLLALFLFSICVHFLEQPCAIELKQPCTGSGKQATLCSGGATRHFSPLGLQLQAQQRSACT